MRILVVDDDTMQLELASAALRSGGHRVELATSDPRTALASLNDQTHIYDVCMIDVMMPEIDGIELARRVRRILPSEAIIIMMTAKRDRYCIDSAFTAGADDYILKPFDEQEIVNRISAIVRRRRLPQRPDAFASDVRAGDNVHPIRSVASVDGLVRPEVVEAYLRALDYGKASLSMATMFAICDWSDRSAADSMSENQIVAMIANVLREKLSATTFVLAYYGGGRIVCVSRKADPVLCARLAREVKRETTSLGFPTDMFHSCWCDFGHNDPCAIIESALQCAATMCKRNIEDAKEPSLPDMFQF